jgi:hypothetical protein
MTHPKLSLELLEAERKTQLCKQKELQNNQLNDNEIYRHEV